MIMLKAKLFVRKTESDHSTPLVKKMGSAYNQCFVIVSDSGESWALTGDVENNEKDGEHDLLPRLLADGWKVHTVTPGSGAKDDTSYWLVLLTK